MPFLTPGQGLCSRVFGPPMTLKQRHSWSISTVISSKAKTKGKGPRGGKPNSISSRNSAVRLCHFIGPDSIW